MYIDYTVLQRECRRKCTTAISDLHACAAKYCRQGILDQQSNQRLHKPVTVPNIRQLPTVPLSSPSVAPYDFGSWSISAQQCSARTSASYIQVPGRCPGVPHVQPLNQPVQHNTWCCRLWWFLRLEQPFRRAEVLQRRLFFGRRGGAAAGAKQQAGADALAVLRRACGAVRQPHPRLEGVQSLRI